MDQDYVEAFKDKNFTELLLKELRTAEDRWYIRSQGLSGTRITIRSA